MLQQQMILMFSQHNFKWCTCCDFTFFCWWNHSIILLNIKYFSSNIGITLETKWIIFDWKCSTWINLTMESSRDTITSYLNSFLSLSLYYSHQMNQVILRYKNVYGLNLRLVCHADTSFYHCYLLFMYLLALYYIFPLLLSGFKIYFVIHNY